MEKTIRDITDEVRQVNVEKGWRERRNSVPEYVALLHSEASEILEAWRTWRLEDATREDGKPEGVGSELADLLIRVIDTADVLGIDLEAEYERKIAFNRTRPYQHGGKAL